MRCRRCAAWGTVDGQASAWRRRGSRAHAARADPGRSPAARPGPALSARIAAAPVRRGQKGHARGRCRARPEEERVVHLNGRWRIVEMDMWDQEAIDLVAPGDHPAGLVSERGEGDHLRGRGEAISPVMDSVMGLIVTNPQRRHLHRYGVLAARDTSGDTRRRVQHLAADVQLARALSQRPVDVGRQRRNTGQDRPPVPALAVARPSVRGGSDVRQRGRRCPASRYWTIRRQHPARAASSRWLRPAPARSERSTIASSGSAMTPLWRAR